MKLDIPGIIVTAGKTEQGPDGPVYTLNFRIARRTRLRLWLGTRLIGLAVRVLPPIARRALAEQMFKDAS